MHDREDPMPRRQGRAASSNPATRYDAIEIALDPAELDPEDMRQVPTEYYHDTSRSILAKNNSPDIPFTYSINVYRGCEHGCIYCYARPSHEYLGWSAGLDFETRILVKPDAPVLLAKAFEARSWEPEVVALSGNTDPYQPIERKLKIVRGCLEVCLRYSNPVGIITKNYLVTRDLDILRGLAAKNLVRVTVSVTTLQSKLASVMEPRTSTPSRRLEAIRVLSDAGIPVNVMVAPIIPGMNEDEIPKIIAAAAERGACRAGYVLLRLPGAVEGLFLKWIQDEFPMRADKVVRRLREMRNGKLNDARFGHRMRGEGPWAKAISRLFKVSCARAGMDRRLPPLATHHFQRASGNQLSLFD